MSCSFCFHVFILQLLSFSSLAQWQVNAEDFANLPPGNQTVHCGFQGNPDIYGIGIRIGYYTQALSVWVSNYFVLSESKTLRSVNLLFFIALFIGLACLSHTPAKFHAIEGYFLNHLLVATWGMGVVDMSRFIREYWRFSKPRLSLPLSIPAYGITPTVVPCKFLTEPQLDTPMR